ncbi:MAG: TatD family hydrolase, partial [Candidatus Omnitrophica bacterium]|nr:TatD family hydrolase [Candidatus Omnitrophota bacterium]
MIASPQLSLVDTHCHLDFPEFDNDREEAISRARQAGIDYIVNIGSGIDNSIKAQEIAVGHKHIYAA